MTAGSEQHDLFPDSTNSAKLCPEFHAKWPGTTNYTTYFRTAPMQQSCAQNSMQNSCGQRTTRSISGQHRFSKDVPRIPRKMVTDSELHNLFPDSTDSAKLCPEFHAKWPQTANYTNYFRTAPIQQRCAQNSTQNGCRQRITRPISGQY